MQGERKERALMQGESSESRQTEHLPPDLTYEILTRTQVKPLMGFKLVCKIWKQFMEDPHFIRQHFDLKSGERLVYFGECKIGSDDIDANITQKDALLCGCNGMVVKKNWETLGLVIENPSTHQETAVPPPSGRPIFHFAVFLVFIESTRTYKLFSSAAGTDGKPLLQVLTLGEDHDWRTQQFFLKEDEEINGYTSTDAFIHMIKLVGDAAQGTSPELVTFDMEHEKFTTTAIERSLFSDWELVDLLNWNGSPAMVEKAARGFNLRIIEDYTRTHRIAGRTLHVELDLPNNFDNATPIVAHNGILWMNTGRKMLSYDLQRRRPCEILDAPNGVYYNGTIYVGRATLETVPEIQSQHRS